MSRVIEAIHWDGVAPTVSIFGVSPADIAPKIDLVASPEFDGLTAIRVYEMEDDECRLGSARIFQFDLQFESLPTELEEFLTDRLDRLCKEHFLVSWLGFEGSFHYDHLLTEDAIDQVYGICIKGQRPVVCLDDESSCRKSLEECAITARQILSSLNPVDHK